MGVAVGGALYLSLSNAMDFSILFFKYLHIFLYIGKIKFTSMRFLSFVAIRFIKEEELKKKKKKRRNILFLRNNISEHPMSA